MKRLIALLVLGSFVAPAYGMGNGESKTRAEVKVHAAAARSADSKRRMDYDFQYEQVGTQEAPKFAERMISVNARLGVLRPSDVHISKNNRVAIFSRDAVFGHDLYGRTLFTAKREAGAQPPKCGAISDDGTIVAFCFKNFVGDEAITIIDLDSQKVITRLALPGITIDSMALSNNGQQLAVMGELKTARENGAKVAVIVFDSTTGREIDRYYHISDMLLNAGVAISPNGNYVLSHNALGDKLCLYDCAKKKTATWYPKERVICAAFVNNTEFVTFSYSLDQVVFDNEGVSRGTFVAKKYVHGENLRIIAQTSYIAPEELLSARMFVTEDGIYLVKNFTESIGVYDVMSGTKVHSYPVGKTLRDDFNAGHYLAIAHDGTVVQHSGFGDNNPDGSLNARCMVYDPLDKADDRKARAQRLRYQQAGKFGKAKINAQKAYSNAKELWRTDKKKFALYTAAAVIVVAAGVSAIKRAKKKKLGTRILSALRFSRHGFDTLRYSPRAAIPSHGGQ